MARRVLAGKATYSGSTKYGIWISKEGVDVTTTATGNTVTDPKNLLFNSVTARTGQLYAGGNISSASAEIVWTSSSKLITRTFPGCNRSFRRKIVPPSANIDALCTRYSTTVVK